MADTGFKTSGNIVSAGTWTGFTTANINTSNNTDATASSTIFVTGTTNNFSFGIPSGATINGIEAQAEFAMNSGAATATIQLSLSYNNGTNYTATKSNTVIGTTDTTRTYGGATDTWGRSWTDSEFANGTFVLKVEGKSSTGQPVGLDYIAVKVYYTAATLTGASILYLLAAQG